MKWRLRWAAGVLAVTVPAVHRRAGGARPHARRTSPRTRRPSASPSPTCRTTGRASCPRCTASEYRPIPAAKIIAVHVDLQDPALRTGEGALQGRRPERVLLQRGEVRRLRRREPLPAARRGVRRLHHRADPRARVGARGAGPGRADRSDDRTRAAGRLLRGRVGAQHRRRGVDQAQPERREPRHRPRRLPHLPRSTRERPDRRRCARQRLRPGERVPGGLRQRPRALRRLRDRSARRSPTSRSPTRATSTAGETCPTARSSRPPPRTSTPTGRAS